MSRRCGCWPESSTTVTRPAVERLEGAFVLPDAEAHGGQPPAEQTYCVRFEANELWGEEAEPRASVSVDLWDSSLEGA